MARELSPEDQKQYDELSKLAREQRKLFHPDAQIKLPEEYESSRMRQAQYGFGKADWLGTSAFRYIVAGGDEELLKEKEKERLKELDRKYSDLSAKDKESGWAMAGEMGSYLIDPTAVPLYLAGGAGVAAKGAQLSYTAQRFLGAATMGSISAGDYAIRELSKGNEIEPLGLALSTGLGAVTGAVFLPKSLKLTKSDEPLKTITTTEGKSLTSKVRDNPLPELEPTELEALESAMSSFYNEAPDTIGKTVGNFGAGYKIAAAKKIVELHRRQRNLRKDFSIRPLTAEKDKTFKELQEIQTILKDDDFKKLSKSRKEATKFLRTELPKLIRDEAEDLSDNVIGMAGKLSIAGHLNENTIRHLVYRPIMGSMAGFGLGSAHSLYSDEEFSPVPWMVAGAGLGALSKKIVNSQYVPSVKEAAEVSVKEVLSHNLSALSNVFFSGGAAAKAQAYGGRVHDLSKALFQQVGGGLRGASKNTVEESSELLQQEFNLSWLKVIENLGVAGGGRAEEIRKAATLLAEGFQNIGTLKSKFSFDDLELDKVVKLGEAAKSLVNQVADEVTNVGLKWKPNIVNGKVQYNLPQRHDTLKMATSEKARGVYREAYTLEKVARAAEAGKVLDPLKVNLNPVDEWFDSMVTYGRSSKSPLSVFSDLTNKKIRPLTSHFEEERFFKSFEARKLLADKEFLQTDIDHLLKEYTSSTIPIAEFARRFGANGEGITSLKNAIRTDFKGWMSKTTTEKERFKLVRMRDKHLKVVNEMVEVYFGTVHKSSWAANSQMSNAVMSTMVTGANLAYLTKVTVSSLGELAQPFMNSGSFNAMKGFARSLDKDTDIGAVTGFSNRDVASHELRQYRLATANPNSTAQRLSTNVNQTFFKYNGLIPFTNFTRRYAYNAGAERAFEIANKISTKRTTALQNQANAAGLSDDSVKILNSFKNVDEALQDMDGKRILNLAGSRAADRDAILPMLSNRRAWSQSNDPYLKSLFQFLSWAQAKTSQTNALITRMEDGDDALFVKMIGSLALYDGIVTFKSFLNDPSGKWLKDKDEDSYKEAYATLKNIGAGVQQSGNFNHVLIDKIARLASSHGGQGPLENLVPVIGWATEMFDSYAPPPLGDLEGSISRNIRTGDFEGATKQALKPLPFGDEILDVLDYAGYPIEDKATSKNRKSSKIGRLYYKGGGEVDIERAPKEPDERIDKMTGVPYDQQAGAAFIDIEDREDPLQRMGFGVGSLVGKFAGKALKAVDDIVEEVPIKTTDEIIEENQKIAKAIEEASPDDTLFKSNIGTEEINMAETHSGFFGFGKKPKVEKAEEAPVPRSLDEVADDLALNTEGKSLQEITRYIGSKGSEEGKEDYKIIAEKVANQLDSLEDQGFSFSFNIARFKKGSTTSLEKPAPANVVEGSAAGMARMDKKKLDVYINDLKPRDSIGNGLNNETILHESIHAATMTAIKAGRFDSQKGTKLYKDVEELDKLYSHVAKQFNERSKSGTLNEFETKYFRRMNNTLANGDELVSWGLTNRDMQKYLESVEYKNTNAWTAFVQKIRDILGLSPKQDTVLSELLRVSDEILSADVKQLSSVVDEVVRKQKNKGGKVLEALRRSKNV